jgi:hypothetical protein
MNKYYTSICAKKTYDVPTGMALNYMEDAGRNVNSATVS